MICTKNITLAEFRTNMPFSFPNWGSHLWHWGKEHKAFCRELQTPSSMLSWTKCTYICMVNGNCDTFNFNITITCNNLCVSLATVKVNPSEQQDHRITYVVTKERKRLLTHHTPKFCFVNSHKTMKFAKVFSLKCFPLHGIAYRSDVTACFRNTTTTTFGCPYYLSKSTLFTWFSLSCSVSSLSWERFCPLELKAIDDGKHLPLLSTILGLHSSLSFSPPNCRGSLAIRIVSSHVPTTGNKC